MSALAAQLLAVESPDWDRSLGGLRHDFYHLPRYVDFAARFQEPGRPAAFAAEEDGQRLFVPLIVRPVPSELAPGDRQIFDATGPRGYPGPLVAGVDGRSGDDFIERAITAFIETLRQHDIIAAYVRLHPLLPLPRKALAAAGTLVDQGTSTTIDLALTPEELWRQTDHGHRSRINKARRLGYVGREDTTWSRFAEFVELYQATMDRVSADRFWHLSPAYFEALRSSLAEHLHLLVVERGDDLAAAGLFTEVDGIVEYHLSGVAGPFVPDSPSKLLIDTARRWAKDRGDRQLHLAGSLRDGDSLAQFKRGFSPLITAVSSWRVITDPVRYQELVDAWRAMHHLVPDAVGGYFPAYRKAVDGPA